MAAKSRTSGPKSVKRTGSGATSLEVPKKKNVRLRQSQIDEAKAILGTSTETETIETALDLVVFRKDLVEGVRSMRGAELVELFESTSE